MPRRFDLGRALLVVGAIVLLVSLFLTWYDTGPSGWEVFEAVDMLLAALALAAVWAAVRPEASPESLPAGGAFAALAVVAIQLIEPPPAAGDGSADVGAWLALASSVVMAAGAILSLARFAVTIEMRERDRWRRVPAVDRREEGAPAAVDDLGRTQSFSALTDDDEEEPRRA
jgi:hypothetical protein